MRSRRWRAAAAAALVAVLMGSRAGAQSAADSSVDKAAETFDAVWTIVRDSHFDPSFDRAQWDRVNEELRPKAIAAKSPGELRKVLAEMLGRLGLSHFAVIPGTPDNPSQYVDLHGQPGFEV